MLTLKTIQSKFTEIYPHGSIIKYTNNKYGIYFDSRDTRNQAEIEAETYHNVSTDKRKLYTYRVSSLKELANKLKLDIPEAEYKLSKLNQEFEEMRKDTTDYSFDLFGE